MSARGDKRKKHLPKFKPTKLRIVSGSFRNTKISYNGDPATRPMKERTRESVFSLLGGKLDGYLAIDLFGGTGILAFESLSRGAVQAEICELARPAIRTILENLKALEMGDRIAVHNVDSLRWMREIEQHQSQWPNVPWIVFCCPPYRMWVNEAEKMAVGLQAMLEQAPAGSRCICETEQSFAIEDILPQYDWDTRQYTPAKISLYRKPE